MMMGRYAYLSYEQLVTNAASTSSTTLMALLHWARSFGPFARFEDSDLHCWHVRYRVVPRQPRSTPPKACIAEGKGDVHPFTE